MHSARSIVSFIKAHGLKLFLGILIGFLITRLNTDFIEAYFYDFRFRMRPTTGHSQDLAMVIANSESVSKIGRIPQVSEFHLLTEKLIEAGAAKIIFVSQINLLEGSDEEKVRFARLIERNPNIIQAVDALEMKAESARLNLKPPFDQVQIGQAPSTYDRKILAKDGVTRRIILSYQGQNTMHFEVAKSRNLSLEAPEKMRGQFELFDTIQSFINFKRPGFIPSYSFESVLNARVELSNDFNQKVVLVGDDYGKDSALYVTTPFSRVVNAMTLTEMHANMIQSLIEDSSPAKAPDAIELAITMAISVFTVFIVLNAKPLFGILVLVGLGTSYFALTFLAFWFFGIVIGVAKPWLAVFVSYYFFIPYRLIVENRRSWEYYQKHKLLKDVETLKTNFIGMMSHDLKTPLARIQGMTEVISRESISIKQREALDTIKNSSEDLLKFISTILSYAKIESEGIDLNRAPVDLNKLIKEVIKKHEFLAQVKHIQIHTELEPIFTIKLDQELIRQVLSNLVENAIKYSPENSKVLITSEEVGNQVVIQVSDQGMGIHPEDLPNIFMKFFRSRNAKSSPIKGSGLGLYLAKYFIELHQGQISVESELNQGTTFTVSLPVSS